MRKYLTLTNVLKAILTVAGVAYILICEVDPFWVFFITMLIVWSDDLLYVKINIGKDERKEFDKEVV